MQAELQATVQCDSPALRGGIVVEVIHKFEFVWIECVDRREDRDARESIRLARTQRSELIQAGDSVFWNQASAYWTPFSSKGKPGSRSGYEFDIRMRLHEPEGPVKRTGEWSVEVS